MQTTQKKELRVENSAVLLLIHLHWETQQKFISGFNESNSIWLGVHPSGGLQPTTLMLNAENIVVRVG